MKLRQYIDESKITASALAERAVVPVACITRFLRGDKGRGFSPVTAAKISHATGGVVAVQDLLYPEGLPEEASQARLASNEV